MGNNNNHEAAKTPGDDMWTPKHAVCFFDNEIVKGTVKLYQNSGNSNTSFSVDLKILDNNLYGKMLGFHIHRYGDLRGGCESTCEHYNPYNRKHGNVEIHGKDRHVGDLINNIKIDKNGICKVKFEDDLVSLYSPNSVIGRSIVIHSETDDLGEYRSIHPNNYRETKLKEGSRTSGNAGPRISCAVIGVSDS